MAGSLGTIRGQMILDVKQALAAYTSARLAHLQTVTALATGGSALQAAGVGIAAVGVAILAGLGQMAGAAAEFERKMDYAGAVTGATDEQLKALSETAIQLGQDTIFSAGQIADSFVELSKSGVSTSDIINGIGQAVANLGAAADIPLDSAANIIMSAVQTFGLSADQAVHVADLLAGAANASIIDVEDLGTSFKYVGGVASSLSIPIESVNDALALLGTYGIKGSTAGTSLRQILVSLTGSTQKATGVLKDLGIITEDGANKFFDAEGKAKPLADIFQILQDATAGLSDEQKVAAFRTIFQNRALAAALDLTKSGAAGFAEMNAAIGQTTAMDVASKRLDNLSGDMEILRGNIETLAITQGSQLQEFLRGIVQGITGAVQWFTNLSEGTQAFILKAAGIAGVVAIVVGVFGMFAGSVLQIIGLGMKLYDAWKLFKTIQAAVTAGQWAMNTAFLANPITWIVLAIAALIAAFVLLWNNNEGFRKFWIGLWADVVNVFNNVVEWFKSIPAWWDGLWAGVGQAVSTIWNGIITFFQSIPGRIMAFFYNWTLPGLLISHWTQIWTTITTVWTSILAFFQAIPGNIANFFSELPGRIGYIIGYMAGVVIGLLIEFGVNAYNFVTTSWNTIVTFFSELPGRIVAFFTELWTNVTTWLTNLYNDAVQLTVNSWVTIIQWFQELPGKVSGFFSELWTKVTTWLTNLAISALVLAIEIYTNIVTWIQELPGKIAGFFSDLYNTVVTKLGEAKDKALEIATNIFNNVRDAIQGLPGLVTDIFDNVVQAVKDQITAGINAVKDFASGLWEGFKDGLGIHSPSYIERAMWQITGVVGEETSRMKSQVRTLQGIGNGIAEYSSSVGDNFNTGVESSIKDLQNQLAVTKDYQNQLAQLGSTSVFGLSTPATSGATSGVGSSPIVVQAGDQIDLDVTWQAAPDDSVSTRQQAKDLLGRTLTIVTDAEVK